MLELRQKVDYGEYVLFVISLGSRVVLGLSDGSICDKDKHSLVAQGSPLVGLVPFKNGFCFGRNNGEIGYFNLRASSLETIKCEFPLASLSTLDELVAVGTELVKPDAGVLVYKWPSNKPLREYMDSHSDDVTDVRFHPTEQNVLISGSTDGTVNLYNLNISDPDEAIYQTINHNSALHRVGFLSKSHFFALSQMETLSIYQVADQDENVAEPQPIEFGDLREAWGCEYVADFVDGHFLIGSNNSQQLKLIPFQDGKPLLITAQILDGAHGEEVARCFCFGEDGQLYTGGEDNCLRVWPLELKRQTAQSSSHTSSSKKLHKKKHSKHNPY